jgi:hypothetical protein
LSHIPQFVPGCERRERGLWITLQRKYGRAFADPETVAPLVKRATGFASHDAKPHKAQERQKAEAVSAAANGEIGASVSKSPYGGGDGHVSRRTGTIHIEKRTVTSQVIAYAAGQLTRCVAGDGRAVCVVQPVFGRT